jgi:hypothetical protein
MFPSFLFVFTFCPAHATAGDTGTTARHAFHAFPVEERLALVGEQLGAEVPGGVFRPGLQAIAAAGDRTEGCGALGHGLMIDGGRDRARAGAAAEDVVEAIGEALQGDRGDELRGRRRRAGRGGRGALAGAAGAVAVEDDHLPSKSK